MLKIENIEVYGFEAAVRGLRNAYNSWAKSDSHYRTVREITDSEETNRIEYVIGTADLALMRNLVKSGSDHRKFMRYITVTMDVTAPLYWWKEAKTYRIGRKFIDNEPDLIPWDYIEFDIETNSCSTMHKISAKEFTLDDFSCEHLAFRQSLDVFKDTIEALNFFRSIYINGGKIMRNREAVMYKPKDKNIWWQMIQLLPSSYNQRRTVQLNYEVLLNMYFARKNHPLNEWESFRKAIESLPYFLDIVGAESDE